MMPSGKSLNVVQRESFFDDTFFKENWEDFDRAVQSILDKFDNRGLKVDQGSRTECRDVYSKIRTSKIDEDLYASQALQITEKDGKFQAVMDVKDFNPRELQVRAVDDRIVVEGSYQKVSEDGASSSSKSFYKEFTLPPAADIDLVTTALSKDGVLTIKAPKKEGAPVSEVPKISSSSTSSSSVQKSSFSDGGSTSSFKSSSSKTVIQSSSSFESSSNDGLEGLPKEMREKLMFSDSGFGSLKTSTCSSPAPSEAGSESSRVSSTMEFDLGKRAPMRTEVAFNVTSPSQPTPQPVFQQTSQPMHQQGPYPQPQSPLQSQFQSPQPQFQSPQPQFQSPQPQFQSPPQPQFQPSPQPQFTPPSKPKFQPPQPQFQPTPQSQFTPPQPQFQPLFQQSPLFMPQEPLKQVFEQFPQAGAPGLQQMAKAPQVPPPAAQVVGSGNQSNISVTEENGRRILTSQTSNVVKEKDGFMEHKETAAEITDKESQAARREATTKILHEEEDPEGKFKRSEAADAAEVSESCIQHMPDGSVMSVKKSSSSTSSLKKSFSSTTGDAGPFFQSPEFPPGFGDLKNLMNRGQSLMSQMSTDSMASTLSGRSGFTDMSNFSHFSDPSSQYSGMSNFSNMSNFSDMSRMSSRLPNQNVPNTGNMAQDFNSRINKSFSSSSSSFNKSSFSSNFGDNF
nr:probable basic-leucine zipper transcription factor N [Cherax quadricarinatus]